MGLTLKQVSESTGLAIPTLSDMENGKRAISATELYRLAKLYNRPLSFFFDEEAASAPFAVLLRSAGGATVDRNIIIQFHEMCRDYQNLKKLVGAPTMPSPPDYSDSKPWTLDDAEHIAQCERSSLGLDGQPIRSICDLLERKRGIRIFHLRGNVDTFSGAIARDEKLGVCFLVNSSHPLRRRVFTVAHEYAHCLAHADQLAHLDSDGSMGTRDRRERFANAFAAAFLMPRRSVEEMWTQQTVRPGKNEVNYEPVIYLATYFGVSFEAMGWRLVALRLLSKDNWDKLRTEGATSSMLARLLGYDNGQDRPETLPSYFKFLAYEAYRTGLVSLQRLAELLRTNYHELRTGLDVASAKGNV